uniref:Uncharacterized protein n=1 Tax=Siphoviridae sp. ct0Bp21 TaxID=2825291 RepID=A0A8S5V2Q6_9CAUD|nr:MAG TPA: hypothetical protein [Siphoviridae sp. ct0Bp21]
MVIICKPSVNLSFKRKRFIQYSNKIPVFILAVSKTGALARTRFSYN